MGKIFLPQQAIRSKDRDDQGLEYCKFYGFHQKYVLHNKKKDSITLNLFAFHQKTLFIVKFVYNFEAFLLR